MSEKTNAPTFFIIGNNLGLDFINTEAAENGGHRELLAEPTDLLVWAAQTKLLELPQAENLKQKWSGSALAAEALAEAKIFRSKIRRLVEDLEKGASVEVKTLTEINRILRLQKGFAELEQHDTGFIKRFRTPLTEPAELLVPVAESVADLLCYGDLQHLRKCENPSCILHFYDTTKNHKRRWCSMSGCGNRAKAALYYQRHRKRIGK